MELTELIVFLLDLVILPIFLLLLLLARLAAGFIDVWSLHPLTIMFYLWVAMRQEVATTLYSWMSLG